jgi:hypothetical protein
LSVARLLDTGNAVRRQPRYRCHKQDIPKKYQLSDALLQLNTKGMLIGDEGPVAQLGQGADTVYYT